jgi:hypothetical protein
LPLTGDRFARRAAQRLLADLPGQARGGRAVEYLTGRPLIIIVVYGHWHAFRDTS